MCCFRLRFMPKWRQKQVALIFNDVADGICKKLIFRHPHVFGDVKAENTDDALASWDAAKLKRKRNEKSQPVHGEYSPGIAGTDARPKSAA